MVAGTGVCTYIYYRTRRCGSTREWSRGSESGRACARLSASCSVAAALGSFDVPFVSAHGGRESFCSCLSVVLGIGCTRIRSCARSNENENIASEECSIYLTLIVCVAVGCACENPERTGELRSEPNAARRPRRPQAGAPRGPRRRKHAAPISTRSSDSLRKHAWQGQPHLGADMTTRHVL